MRPKRGEARFYVSKGDGGQVSGDAGSVASSQVGKGGVWLLRKRGSFACAFRSPEWGRRGQASNGNSGQKHDGREVPDTRLGLPMGKGIAHGFCSFLRVYSPLQQNC